MADGCIHVGGVAASLTGAAALVILAFGNLPTLSVVNLAVYGTERDNRMHAGKRLEAKARQSGSEAGGHRE